MTEIYTGIKFKVVRQPEKTAGAPRVAELIKAGRVLASKGFCPQNCGNMSTREVYGFVITRAGSELGKLTPADFVRVHGVSVEAKKVFVAGEADPSSETLMHFLIYAARPDIAVILHAHGLKLEKAFTTSQAYAYATVEGARCASEALKSRDVIILKGHGFVSVGKTMAAALARVR